MVGSEATRIPESTLELIDRVVQNCGVCPRDKILEAVCAELEELWPDDELEKQAKAAKLATTKQIRAAIDEYFLAVSEGRFVSGSSRARRITDGVLSIIEGVARDVASGDRLDILDAVCDHLTSRFRGGYLEYHLRQMDMCTTSDLLYAIDVYRIGQKYNVFDKPA